MWERTLQDLIKGLRANKKDESKFIAQAVDEIRQEVRSKDMDLKAAAILKLTYVSTCSTGFEYRVQPCLKLDMMGYDMNWASFHVVEVMSSPRVHLKTVGYLAATQSFSPDTDVLMLTTNLLKKVSFARSRLWRSSIAIQDLTSAAPADVAVALNGMSHVTTTDLARDLSRDLISQLNHSRAHVRKRAVIAMYKVFTEYPEAIPAGMPRFGEKLEDPDPGVVAATVNVLCEIARKDPPQYLTLAPRLFHLLTTSTNNWMLIKIIKLVRAPVLARGFASQTFTLVWRALPLRAAAGEEAAATHIRTHCHHLCYLAAIRMRTHMHNRRNASRVCWERPRNDMCDEACCVSPRPRP
jgi:AP-3 complex subunit delta-1